MAGVEIKPFSDLPQNQIPDQANWVATGSGPGWSEITDTRYGTIKHIKVTNEDGTSFDKVNLVWTPGAFIVVFRFNPDKDNKVEYLLPKERRPVLRDENGTQGNVSIRNIPQGVIKVWKDETAIDAAIRETREETGANAINIIHMRDLYFDAANSETPMPFFLAEVDFKDDEYSQTLEPGEKIEVSEKDWFGLDEIQDLQLQCAKTLAGIYLSTGFLGVWQEATYEVSSPTQIEPV